MGNNLLQAFLFSISAETIGEVNQTGHEPLEEEQQVGHWCDQYLSLVSEDCMHSPASHLFGGGTGPGRRLWHFSV